MGMWLKVVPRAYAFWSAAAPPSPASLPQWHSLLLVCPASPALGPGRSGLGSVKVAKWRRGHSPKTPSGSNSEGQGQKKKISLCFFFWSKLSFGSGVTCGGILFCGTHRGLFRAEQGDGYYESGVAAFSIPERCLGTEGLHPARGHSSTAGGAAFFVQREVRRCRGQPQPSGPGRQLSEVTGLVSLSRSKTGQALRDVG